MLRCDAGRSALLGGRWPDPCPNQAAHRVGPPGRGAHLCAGHFAELNNLMHDLLAERPVVQA